MSDFLHINDMQTCSTSMGRYGWLPVEERTVPFLVRKNVNYCPESLVKEYIQECNKRELARGNAGYILKGYFMSTEEATLFNYVMTRHCPRDYPARPHFFVHDGLVTVPDMVKIIEKEENPVVNPANVQAAEQKVAPTSGEPTKYFPVGWVMFAGFNTPYVNRDGRKYTAELIIRQLILDAYAHSLGAKKLYYPIGLLPMTQVEAALFTKFDAGKSDTKFLPTDTLIPIEELLPVEEDLKKLSTN